MELRVAASTDVGLRRKANEDRYAVAPELGLYVVADGMGGHTAGQVASQVAVEGICDALRALRGATASPAEKLRFAMAAANRAVHDRATEQAELSGMGTTLVALLAVGGRAALVHVGDSRAYRVREGRIRQLTDDHSVVGELVRRNEISLDDARDHPHRHVLTRAVGVRPEVEADLAELTLEPGDIFVMCTDGLTNLVEDHEIAKAVTGDPDLQEVADLLIDLANGRGGDDNTTVVLLRCDEA